MVSHRNGGVNWKWVTAVSFCGCAISGPYTLLLCTCIHRNCWPFDGDQPTMTADLNDNLKVIFGFVEARIGPDGLKPMNGLAGKGTCEVAGHWQEIRKVLDICRREQSDELRRNAEELKQKFEKAWEDGGEACESSTRSWNGISVAHEVRSVQLRPIDKLPVTTPVAVAKHRKRFEVVQKAADDCFNDFERVGVRTMDFEI